MQFDNTQALDAADALPVQPVAPRSDRSAWGAPWRAVKAGAADLLGSTADVLKGFGAASAMTLEADPVARSVLGTKAVEQGAAAGRKQIADGESLTSGVGESFRSVARDMRPDPATASTAEKIVFGAVRPITKLVGAGLTLGPIGLGLASAEEGFTQAADLQNLGVDQLTRTKVGALSAGATAAGAFLPLVGPSLKATAGLYLAGGPGAYMAQQVATRAILEQANYAELGKQYDPFDPLGLGLAFAIPFPFAAHGALRNVRAMRAEKVAAVDTSAAPVQKPAEPVQVAPEIVDAAMAHNLTTLNDAHRSVDELQVTSAKAAAELAPSIPNDQEKALLALLRSGDREEMRLSLQGLADDVQKGVVSTEEMARRLTEATRAKSADEAFYVMDVLDGKAATLEEAVQREAKMVGDHRARMDAAHAALAEAGVEPPMFFGTDALDAMRAEFAANGASPRFKELAVQDAMAYHGGRAKRTVQDAAPTAAAPAGPDFGRLASAVESARNLIAEAQAQGKSLDALLNERKVLDEVNNVVVGLREAAQDPRRMNALVQRLVQEARDQTKPVADATADAVDGMRSLTDQQLRDIEAPPKNVADPVAQSVANRVKQVETAAPNMVVRTDESGQVVTVADELARVRKEAAEGTDSELGSLDADLLRVAAECALSIGGV